VNTGGRCCPKGMLNSGAGFCIDSGLPNQGSEGQSYADAFSQCSKAGKQVCSYVQMYTAVKRGTIAPKHPVMYRIRDIMLWTFNDFAAFGGAHEGNEPGNLLWGPTNNNALPEPPGVNGGMVDFYCCS
jgi:hypothetical protein